MQVATTLGPVSVLSVSGAVDAATFSDLLAKGDEILNAGHANLVLDLSDVDYISSAGLVALRTIHSRAASRGGRMVLACVPDMASQVLLITGLKKVLDIYPDVGAAKDSFA